MNSNQPIIAYAMPIGGGWGTVCIECRDAHAEDEGSADAIAAMVPIYPGCEIRYPICEICGQDVTLESDDARRHGDWETNHVHYWDGDERCTVCGEDGRA